jgi:hypothetical protein
MSIPPQGWEQTVQSEPAQSSPVQCSTPVSDPDSISDVTPTYDGPLSPGSSAVQLPPLEPPARGFLHIVRHGAGPSAIYVVTYRRLDRIGTDPRPVLAEGARLLIELLERLGVDLELSEVRGALEDILRLGSANIPDLWLSDEPMAAKGLIEDEH